MITMRPLDFLEKNRVLITGGTGSLGKKLTRIILDHTATTVVVIYSRDEYKQFEMELSFTPAQRQRLRFFLGDVRDGDRLRRALDGVRFIIHASALKQVPAAEYNPFEFVKTNILGAQNVIDAAIDSDVTHVVALSTDKAANPINLYGATKLCSDKLFVSGNSYSGRRPTRFSVVRYGNVVGSRGSVIPFFLARRREGVLPITDPRMTRFWITLEQGAALVLNALQDMKGGELWVPKIPSMRITDLARVIGPECQTPVVGIRPGEKLHEVMIPVDDGRQTIEFNTHFIIRPAFPWWGENWHMEKGGRPCPDGFYYGSDNNTDWLDDARLARMIADLDLPEAQAWAKERGI
ncbi:MAG TPA: UDP-N-acetylglucosamine 4,6-dehydratase (inverting) [Kiritimatiellia bacterium]|nr:UDP-N-acetylglucosamine 4,6-dehydratase (inverting) [Kiritimatiellia bacterium]HRZ11470.1 UDP-N-acetylglucosamine 4,6-dehydratase (inverting) [Kiritimatiellia bacterium]HSA16979.1 UDP-N-acetylglucosamine 4,6-dehydratase (inverting) [Kiritimatiellia bacterium]